MNRDIRIGVKLHKTGQKNSHIMSRGSSRGYDVWDSIMNLGKKREVNVAEIRRRSDPP